MFALFVMQVVGCGNVDDVHLRVGEHFGIARIEAAEGIFLTVYRFFFSRARRQSVQFAAVGVLESLAEFFCYLAEADYSPLYLSHCPKCLSSEIVCVLLLCEIRFFRPNIERCWHLYQQLNLCSEAGVLASKFFGDPTRGNFLTYVILK